METSFQITKALISHTCTRSAIVHFELEQSNYAIILNIIFISNYIPDILDVAFTKLKMIVVFSTT